MQIMTIKYNLQKSWRFRWICGGTSRGLMGRTLIVELIEPCKSLSRSNHFVTIVIFSTISTARGTETGLYSPRKIDVLYIRPQGRKNRASCCPAGLRTDTKSLGLRGRVAIYFRESMGKMRDKIMIPVEVSGNRMKIE